MDANTTRLLVDIVQNTRIAALGTLHDEAPHVSFVAFVAAADFSAFYIHASRLAQHTVDMQKDKHVSLMIAETDDGRSDPQTLARVSIRGSAEFLPAGEPGYNPIKSLYLARFPESEPRFKMTDFGMWRIVPKGARYIAGIAKAYNLTAESLKKATASTK
jgi:putative heme iron utilization protein